MKCRGGNVAKAAAGGRVYNGAGGQRQLELRGKRRRGGEADEGQAADDLIGCGGGRRTALDMVWPQANDEEHPALELRCASDAIAKHP